MSALHVYVCGCVAVCVCVNVCVCMCFVCWVVVKSWFDELCGCVGRGGEERGGEGIVCVPVYFCCMLCSVFVLGRGGVCLCTRGLLLCFVWCVCAGGVCEG